VAPAAYITANEPRRLLGGKEAIPRAGEGGQRFVERWDKEPLTRGLSSAGSECAFVNQCGENDASSDRNEPIARLAGRTNFRHGET
jgi:hypothetical protein